jgi:hypothetical protein
MKKTTSLFAQLLSILSFSSSVFSQSIYVNETDINKLDIKYCELRIGQPLNPTKGSYVEQVRCSSRRDYNL